MNRLHEKGSQLPLDISVGDKASFENFWVGHNHELATAIAASVKTGDPKLLYFYGPKSAGKSHLLFASMRLAKAEIMSSSYVCLGNSVVSPSQLESIDVHHLVCVDDLHAWAGNAAGERALFTLMEQIKHAGGQLLISAIQPPEALGLELMDLVSRLSSGLVYPLQALTEEQQFEAIKMRAGQRGLSISEETVRYLMSRSSRDTGELFDLLENIDRASLIEKRRITIPFLQSLMKS